MKSKLPRSNQHKIQLVLAGMLVAGMVGCDKRRALDNDSYVTDRGFYHSETGGFYPYPYNHYVPGFGYYGGSRGWTGSPHRFTNGVRSYPKANNVYVAPLPNIPPPAPRPSQIYSYSKPVSAPAATKYSSPTVTTAPSKPAPSSSFSSGARTGGFGSSAGSSSGS